MKTPYFFFKKMISFIILLLIANGLFAQVVSKPKDIAVFSLSYYDSTIPFALVEEIDARVLSTAHNFKRLRVIGVDKRLMYNDLNAFYRAIQESREVNTIIPEEVAMGHVAFTRADWNKAVNAYYILTSNVEDYDIQTKSIEQQDGTLFTEYEVSVSVLFTVYSVQEKQKHSEFMLTATAKDKRINEAFRQLASMIGVRLEGQLRNVGDFRINTGVIATENPRVYFELGNTIGIYKGDEYAIIGYDSNNNPVETGLLVVVDTQQDFSTALTLYADPDVVVGDQLREIPHLPMEFRTYSNVEFGTAYYSTAKNTVLPLLTGGLHISWTRGVYRVRPSFAFEINGFWGIYPVFSGSIGAEIMNTYIGRCQILPTLHFFYTVAASKEKNVAPTTLELGGKLITHISWLFARDFKIGLDIGIKSGYTTNPQMPFLLRGVLGLGLTVKL